MNKKIIWGVVIAVAVVIVGIYGLKTVAFITCYNDRVAENCYVDKFPYFSKTDKNLVTSVDMADWKIYKNEKYGFEFQYPSEYQLDDKIEKQGFYEYQITKISDVGAKENYIDDSSFEVNADNTPYNLSVCLTKDYGDQPHTSTLTKVINGNTFSIFSDKVGDAAMGGVRGVESQYRAIHDNYCYIVNSHVHWHEVGYEGYINTGKNDATPAQTQAQHDAISKHEQILDQILSTFKFTK
ncbi:MAG: hypothetical protein ABI430_01830 [Candidatus Taylorbacteria bacterium]